jgi:hypothetical protein
VLKPKTLTHILLYLFSHSSPLTNSVSSHFWKKMHCSHFLLFSMQVCASHHYLSFVILILSYFHSCPTNTVLSTWDYSVNCKSNALDSLMPPLLFKVQFKVNTVIYKILHDLSLFTLYSYPCLTPQWLIYANLYIDSKTH